LLHHPLTAATFGSVLVFVSKALCRYTGSARNTTQLQKPQRAKFTDTKYQGTRTIRLRYDTIIGYKLLRYRNFVIFICSQIIT